MEEQRGSLGLGGSGPQQSWWEWLLEGFGQMGVDGQVDGRQGPPVVCWAQGSYPCSCETSCCPCLAARDP